MRPGIGLAILAALALLLAHRRPAWRPFALSLVALACIDVARLWTSPLAQTRAAPWWQVDVALVALWPVALAVGLLRGDGYGSLFEAVGALLVRLARVLLVSRLEVVRLRLAMALRTRREVAAALGTRHASSDAHGGPRRRVPALASVELHAPILPRLAALACFALALGAARPWLPRIAYLSALRLPRWSLAALWVGALWRLKGEGPGRTPGPSELPQTYEVASVTAGRSTPAACSAPPVVMGRPAERLPSPGPRPKPAQCAHSARLAQACALILAGCNFADLLAGAWLVPPWEAPAWGYARAVTWAAYGAVACVMGWAWLGARRA